MIKVCPSQIDESTMRAFDRTAVCALALLTGAWIGLGAQQAQQSPAPPAPQGATPVPSDKAPGPEFFNGTWDYNADYSVNAATGRPEQNPKAANTRRPPGSTGSGAGGARPPGGGSSGGSSGGTGAGGTGGGGLGPGGGTGGYGGGGAGGYGGSAYPGGSGGGFGGGDSGLSPFTLSMSELRALNRDLLEVPEVLKIKVTDGTVSFTDDLDRERTYPTTGKKQHYQLGAASYDAKVHWEGNQLFKEIEGTRGFKMHETYFLSEDGKRLFVIIRVGDPPTEKEKEKGAQIVGVNRVYDRVANGGGND